MYGVSNSCLAIPKIYDKSRGKTYDNFSGHFFSFFFFKLLFFTSLLI